MPTKCLGSEKIICIHQNMCSIKNKKIQLESQLVLTQPNIVCLSEHWLRQDEISSCHFQNYTLASHYCRNTTSGGGVCIYVKDNLTFKVINIEKWCQDKVFEACCIILPRLNICITVVYRSPIRTNIDQFFSSFEKILIETHKVKFQVICGDFNIDLIKNDSLTTRFRNLLLKFNLHCTISAPTRSTHASKTTIDNILTNIDKKNYNASNYVTAISDHDAQIINIERTVLEPNIPNSRGGMSLKRVFGKENITQFNRLLCHESWQDIYALHDPNLAWNAFSTTFSRIFNQAFPKKLVHDFSTRTNTWMTKGLSKSHDTLKALRYKIRYNSNSALKEYAKRYEKIYHKLVVEAKKYNNNKIINNSTNKNKQMWRLIKKETKANLKQKNISLQINNRLIDNPNLIAKEFNKYFTTVSAKLLKEIKTNDQTCNTLPVKSLIETNLNSLFFTPVTEDDVVKTIKKLKNKNSAGLDEVPITLIKKCCYNIKIPLTFILNICLAEGIFPDRLKWAKVVPIHKKGDEKDMNNYRPIAVLSSFSKVFEKIIAIKLENFLETNKIMSPSQFGFLKGKSTEQAVYSFINKVITALDNKDHALGIFADLTKAFDCVDHSLLLEKLEAYGVRGVANDLFKSYLQNRYQVTSVQFFDDSGIYADAISNHRPITVGVPQGSILGPILFIIFINDLPLSITNGDAVMFADDTNILLTDKNINDLTINANATLHELSNWFQKNKLILNISKSFLIKFSLATNKKSTGEDYTIFIGSQKVEVTQHVKFLGLQIDSNLNWNLHKASVCRKLSSMCFAMHTVKSQCSLEVVLALYFSCVQSVLAYGIIFWGNSSNWIKVFKLQKKIIRIINGKDHRSPCRPLFKELNILSFPCLYIYKTILFSMHNISHNLNHNIHTHYTRSHNNIHTTTHRTIAYSQSPFYSGIKLLNSLPPDLRTIESKNLFKMKLKKYLIKNSFYSIEEFLVSGRH